jgi:hypothetical protein
MTPIRFLTLALTVLAVTSCDGGPFVNPVQPAGPVWEEPQFSALLKTYHQKLPGKTRVLELALDESWDLLRVHDLSEPDDVSEYNYFRPSGPRWRGPNPGMLREGESLAESLFYLDQVALQRIPGLVRTAKEKMSFEGAKIVWIFVKRGPPPARDVQIEIIMDGKYNSGRLFADSQGNVLKVEIL